MQLCLQNQLEYKKLEQYAIWLVLVLHNLFFLEFLLTQPSQICSCGHLFIFVHLIISFNKIKGFCIRDFIINITYHSIIWSGNLYSTPHISHLSPPKRLQQKTPPFQNDYFLAPLSSSLCHPSTPSSLPILVLCERGCWVQIL